MLPRSRTARPDDTPSVHAVGRKTLGNPRGSSPVNAGALPRSCRSTTSTSEINKHKGQLFVEAVEPRAAGADRRSHGRRSPGTRVVPAQTGCSPGGSTPPPVEPPPRLSRPVRQDPGSAGRPRRDTLASDRQHAGDPRNHRCLRCWSGISIIRLLAGKQIDTYTALAPSATDGAA